MIYKRLIAGWASLVLMLSLFSLTPPAHAEDSALYEISTPAYLSAVPSSETDRSITENTALKTYLREQLLQFSESIDLLAFRIPATSENISALIRLIQFQLPELIHLTTYYQYSVTGGMPSYLELLVPHYNPAYNAETLQTNLGRCQKIAAGLVEDLGDCSDVEKTLLLHDRIALICSYDHDAAADSTAAPEAFNMAGVLLNGKAVCQGIAVTYQYLLDQVGIKNRICISDALNHAWNIVTVDGKEYHVDITWDDPSIGSSRRDITGYVRHKNFLRSSAGIRATGHAAYDYDTLPSDTTYDGYFWQDIVTSFQHAGDELYYIDQQESAIMRFSDSATVLDLSGEVWQRTDGGIFMGNFSYLAGDGIYLLYSTPKAICRLDPQTMHTEVIYQPTLPNNYLIFGFRLQEGYLYCELHDEPYPSAFPENIQIASAKYAAVGLNDVVLLLRHLIGSIKNVNIGFFDQNGDQSLSIADAVILLNRLVA